MGVNCQILLQKTNEGFYRAGQPVVGTLKYIIDDQTKIGSADICFVGKGKCQWSESVSTSTIYYKNEEEYVKLDQNLFIAREDQDVLSENFEHPFEFLLPDNIPTSIKNTTCTIEYKVIVTFIKKNLFKTKCKFDAEVPVHGYVIPCSPEPVIFGLQKNLLSLTSNNNINVKVEIDRTFLTPGENITLKLTINNDSDVPITIRTELIQYFTYVAEGNKKKKVERESVKTTTGFTPTIKEKSVSELECVVPTLPSLYSIQNSKILIGEYKVRVTAKVPFPHINAVVEVPVVIGERHLGAAVVDYANETPWSSETFEKADTNSNEQPF